jgi:hypothetical protein
VLWDLNDVLPLEKIIEKLTVGKEIFKIEE